MSYQDEIEQLSRRMRVYTPLPGVIAAAVYFLTLARGTVPGVSAALSASAAGLTPPTEAAHPLFACATRLVAATGLFSLPVRLNLFSAACGALGAMLFYHLVSRLVLFSACKDSGANKTGGGEARRRRDASPPASEEPQPPVVPRTPRIFRIAVWSGLLASALLTFTAPFWSASTHLDRGPFDLLLALASLSLYPVTRTAYYKPRLLASVTLFTCGLLESPTFLFLLPVYAFVLFKLCFSFRRRFVLLGQLALAGVAGLAIMLAAYRFNSEDAAMLSGVELLGAFARSAASCIYWEAKTFFPAAGWVLPLLQVGLAASLVVFGRKTLFHARRRDTAIMLGLLALVTAPGLLLLPLAPHNFFATSGRLPVFAHAVLALGAAVAFAASRIALISAKQPQTADEAPRDKRRSPVHNRHASAAQATAKAVAPFILLVALLTPFRNLPAVRDGRGAFADAVARELLDLLKNRRCLVTNGSIDNNLRLLADARNQPLTLVSLRPDASRQEHARLQRAVASDPLFEDGLRVRLQNALSINPTRLISEWLRADTNAYRQVLIDAAPDFWTACGFRPVPEGLAYGGIRPDEKPDTAPLIEQTVRFAERIAPLLAPDPSGRTRPYDALRQSLALRASFSANELGVFLEELGEHRAAYASYANALNVDPQNLSAAINICELATAKNFSPETHDQLKKRIKSLLSDRRVAALGLAGIVQRYGTVRHPAFYQQQALRWKAVGTDSVATVKMRKAMELVDQTGRASLLEKAFFYEQMGDAAQAEETYRAALADGQPNRNAFLGLCRLAIERHDAAQASDWLKKATDAGATPSDLLAPTIDLALLNTDLPLARKLLTDAVKQHPDSARYWGLLAEVLVKQGDALQVKQALLPEMQKKRKAHQQYLVHAIRGTLLIQAGASTVKEGRLELQKSLSLNAAQPNVWRSVLLADMVLGNPAFIEADARALLSIDPDHALANCLMGSVLLGKNKPREAEDFLRRSLAKEPSANACNDLAEALRLQDRAQEAETFARQAISLDGRLATAHDTLANALCDLGRLDEAAREARTACEFDNRSPAYSLTLLRILVKQGDTEAAKRQLQTLDKAGIAVPDVLRGEFRKLK